MRILLLSVALLPLLASAQIPNGGFENWVVQGGYIEPAGWLTYNDVITTGGPLASVEQGTPGFPGNYHCVITTRAVPGGMPIQGWLSAGSIQGQAGFPYTQRPSMLTGQWQYGIQPGDTAEVTVALKGSASNELIAIGTLEVIGTQSAWQAFSVPIEYLSSETPDTAYIQIVSSINFSAPVAGSFVKVDDLAFAGTVGMSEHRPATVHLFPSPATDVLNIQVDQEGEFRLFDAAGRIALRTWHSGSVSPMDISGLEAGLYIYQLIGRNQQAIATGRWVKE